MTQIDPIQAQLTAARRNQILEAATKVFAEKGFERATIKDIAKTAGIADGTIYNYFENKTALLLGILDRFNETEQREPDFAQAAKGDIREWMRAYMRRRFETLQPMGLEVFRVLISQILIDVTLRERYFKQIVEPTYAVAQKFFQEWAKDGTIRPIDPALTMRVITGAFLGLIVLRLAGDKTVENQWDEIADVLSDLILNGLLHGENNEQGTSES